MAQTDPANGKSVVIIGGGPAGLTAALELSRHHVPAKVLEADKQVGGISRTVNYKGYLFDIGGHRFFTKWEEVNEIWEQTLGDKFLLRPRLSRIYYRKKVLPLSAGGEECSAGAGARGKRSDSPQLLPFRAFPDAEGRQPGGVGLEPVRESGFTRFSSRPIPRKSGACPARQFRRSGQPSGSAASR